MKPCKKMTFSIRDFFGKCNQMRIWGFGDFSPVDLVTFTEEIPNGKLQFLCSEKGSCKK